VGVAVNTGVIVNVGAEVNTGVSLAVDKSGVFVAVDSGITFSGRLQEVTNRNRTTNTIQRSFDIRFSPSADSSHSAQDHRIEYCSPSWLFRKQRGACWREFVPPPHLGIAKHPVAERREARVG
jgi:hypothetical protein